MSKEEISLAELADLPEGSYLLADVRDAISWQYGSVPGSVSYPDILDDAVSGTLDKTKKLVLVCMHGTRSFETAYALRSLGYDAVSLHGGYGAWIMANFDDTDRTEEIEKTLRQNKRFHRTLFSRFAKAINTYELIQPGDKIAVCISGGKDSMLMAKLFQEFQVHGQRKFDLVFLCMDPGYNEANRHIIESNAKLLGIPVIFFETTIFDAVYNIRTSPCYLCARMRRGYLYKKARELGCNKIALGHHFDDVIETALMGMLNSGQFNAMMPKLKSTSYPGMELIRPLYFVREDDIKRWRDYYGLHFIQCACHFTDTCTTCAVNPDGSHTGSKRVMTKMLIAQLRKDIPDVETNIFHATENVTVDQLLGYKYKGKKHSFLDEY